MLRDLQDRLARLSFLGWEGVERLSRARIAVVGAGAVGSMALTALARMGVGYIRIIDRDYIEPSNLGRQVLYTYRDAVMGRAKAEAAAERLREIYPGIMVEAYVNDLNPSNIDRLLRDVDLIIDGTDNMEVRFLINDYAVKYRIPWIYGGAISTYGVSLNINPGGRPCLSCIIPRDIVRESLPTCDTVGIHPSIAYIIGSIEAGEASKYISNGVWRHGLFTADILHDIYDVIDVEPWDECPTCRYRRFEFLSMKRDRVVRLCSGSLEISPGVDRDIDLDRLMDRLSRIGDARRVGPLIHYRDGEVDFTIFRDGRMVLRKPLDMDRALSIYYRYIG